MKVKDDVISNDNLFIKLKYINWFFIKDLKTFINNYIYFCNGNLFDIKFQLINLYCNLSVVTLINQAVNV